MTGKGDFTANTNAKEELYKKLKKVFMTAQRAFFTVLTPNKAHRFAI